METVLQFNKIEKSFGKHKVLDKVSFEVDRGEIVCLLGPSGSGKSTLFNIASGLLKADKGNIKISHDYRTGYVFQQPRLLPWKTVSENISFVQENYLTEKKAKRIRKELLLLNGLDDFSQSYPGQLSGGMKQRLEIIRGLSIWPDLILMDEPFKSIDAQLKVNLREMLLRFYEKTKLTVLLITHDPEEAVLLADRILILSGKPAYIKKEFKINKLQRDRNIGDKQLLSINKEIINLFMEMVGDYRWNDNENTAKLFEKMKGS